MADVEETIDIRAPIESVFEALTDPRRATEWNSNIIEVRDISPYPPREGTTWKQMMSIMGRHVDVDCRVARYEPPQLGQLEVSGGYEARIWTRCQEVNGGTRVSQGIEYSPPGGLKGLLAKGIVGPTLHRELKQTLTRQRDVLERELGGSSGSRTS